MPPKGKFKWDVARARLLRGEGRTFTEIGAILGVHPTTITGVFKARGWETADLRPVLDADLLRLAQCGLSFEELAAQIPLQRQRLRARLRHLGFSYPRKKPRQRRILPTEELVSLYQDGWSAGDLAQRCGVSKRTVLLRLQACGVKMRPSGWTRDDPRSGIGYDKARERAALTREGRALSPMETYLVEEFRRRYAIHLTLNLAVGRYNLDAACPVRKVAIEIDTGGGARNITVRDTLLRAQGWIIERHRVASYEALSLLVDRLAAVHWIDHIGALGLS